MDFIQSPDEQLLWQGSPDRKVYYKMATIEFFGTFGFFAFTWTLIIALTGVNKLNWSLMYLIAFMIISTAVYKFFKKLILYRKIAYFITTERIVIIQGGPNCKTTIFDRSRIRGIDLKKHKVEENHRAGTVIIHLGEEKDNEGFKEKLYYELRSIKEPENVIRLL